MGAWPSSLTPANLQAVCPASTGAVTSGAMGPASQCNITLTSAAYPALHLGMTAHFTNTSATNPTTCINLTMSSPILDTIYRNTPFCFSFKDTSAPDPAVSSRMTAPFTMLLPSTGPAANPTTFINPTMVECQVSGDFRILASGTSVCEMRIMQDAVLEILAQVWLV